MRINNLIAAIAALLFWSSAARAQETVHFPSLDGTTQLDGYLYRPTGEGRHAAIVGLHGCSGMFNRATGAIWPIFRQWAGELARQGYVFLLVDSFGPRNHGEMCSTLGFDLDIYRTRPKDAYGALWYLQAQPFVRGDHIGLSDGRRAAGSRCTQSPRRASGGRRRCRRAISAPPSHFIPVLAVLNDSDRIGRAGFRCWC